MELKFSLFIKFTKILVMKLNAREEITFIDVNDKSISPLQTVITCRSQLNNVTRLTLKTVQYKSSFSLLQFLSTIPSFVSFVLLKCFLIVLIGSIYISIWWSFSCV